jgi:hypothetical protein
MGYSTLLGIITAFMWEFIIYGIGVIALGAILVCCNFTFLISMHSGTNLHAPREVCAFELKDVV